MSDYEVHSNSDDESCPDDLRIDSDDSSSDSDDTRDYSPERPGSVLDTKERPPNGLENNERIFNVPSATGEGMFDKTNIDETRSHDAGDQTFSQSQLLKGNTDLENHIENVDQFFGKLFGSLDNPEKICPYDPCYSILDNESDLSRHILLYHITQVYKCDVCGSLFPSEEDLSRHDNIHYVDDNYVDDFDDENKCSLSFNTNIDETIKISIVGDVVGDKDVGAIIKKEKNDTSASSDNEDSYEKTDKPPNESADMKRLIRLPHVFGSEGIEKQDPDGKISKKCNLQTSGKSETSRKSYKCTTCFKVFRKLYHLKRHKKIHSKIHKCRICGKVFPWSHKLKLHENTHRTDNVKEKDACASSDSEDLNKKIIGDVLNVNMKDDEEFETRHPNNDEIMQNLKKPRPRRRNQPIKWHECETCGKVFPRPGRLKVHEETHKHPDDRISIKKSEKSSSEKDEANKKLHKCSTCGKIFPMPWRLKVHEKIHGPKRLDPPTYDYNCLYCDRRYKNISQLKSHTFYMHFNPQLVTEIKYHRCTRLNQDLYIYRSKSFVCSVCSDYHVNRGRLVEHIMRRHGAGKKFGCDECNIKFCTKWELQQHYSSKIHNNVDVCSCEICGKGFPNTGGLRSHMVRHSDLKPFQCSLCGVTFARNNELKNHHLMNHSGEKKHHCNLCGRRYFKLSHVHRHVALSHNPDKVVSAKRKYTRKKHMHVHMEKCHGVREAQSEIGRDIQSQRNMAVFPRFTPSGFVGDAQSHHIVPNFDTVLSFSPPMYT